VAALRNFNGCHDLMEVRIGLHWDVSFFSLGVEQEVHLSVHCFEIGLFYFSLRKTMARYYYVLERILEKSKSLGHLLYFFVIAPVCTLIFLFLVWSVVFRCCLNPKPLPPQVDSY